MKITSKTTKKELKDILNLNVKAVKEKDKNLYDRIVYTGKASKEDDSKVSRKDLVDLVKEVMKALGESLVVPAIAEETPVEVSEPAEPKAENSVKKLSKGKKAVEEKVEAPSETPTPETVETPVEEPKKAEKVDKKKSANKSLGKKKEEPKEGVTVLENTSKSEKTVQMAKLFPQTLEVGETKFELAPDIKTMEDLYKAYENDEEIMFAYYWTKRHLRQFPYFNGWLGQPKSFDNDLDLATAIYVSDEKKVSYQVSRYTEAVYTILPEDLEVEDDIRVAGGIEFQVYRAV